jgi:hypothetical protein
MCVCVCVCVCYMYACIHVYYLVLTRDVAVCVCVCSAGIPTVLLRHPPSRPGWRNRIGLVWCSAFLLLCLLAWVLTNTVVLVAFFSHIGIRENREKDPPRIKKSGRYEIHACCLVPDDSQHVPQDLACTCMCVCVCVCVSPSVVLGGPLVHSLAHFRSPVCSAGVRFSRRRRRSDAGLHQVQTSHGNSSRTDSVSNVSVEGLVSVISSSGSSAVNLSRSAASSAAAAAAAAAAASLSSAVTSSASSASSSSSTTTTSSGSSSTTTTTTSSSSAPHRIVTRNRALGDDLTLIVSLLAEALGANSDSQLDEVIASVGAVVQPSIRLERSGVLPDNSLRSFTLLSRRVKRLLAVCFRFFFCFLVCVCVCVCVCVLLLSMLCVFVYMCTCCCCVYCVMCCMCCVCRLRCVYVCVCM